MSYCKRLNIALASHCVGPVFINMCPLHAALLIMNTGASNYLFQKCRNMICSFTTLYSHVSVCIYSICACVSNVHVCVCQPSEPPVFNP